MATDKPRVTVTLDPDAYALVRELSSLNGESMSKIIGDLVMAVTPTLRAVIDAGREFEQLQASVQDDIRAQFVSAEARIMPQVNEMQSEFIALIESVGAASKPEVDPRPVTRGSRPPHLPTDTDPDKGLS